MARRCASSAEEGAVVQSPSQMAVHASVTSACVNAKSWPSARSPATEWRMRRAATSMAPTTFDTVAMEAFAERARVELEATGEHARKRTVETRDDLTPQETQISRLAADGATNQEIAGQLYISPS